MLQAGTLSRAVFIAAIVFAILLGVGAMVFLWATYSSAKDPADVLIARLLWGLLVAATVGIFAWGCRGLSRLGHVTATKKVKIASEEVRVYQEPDSRSPLVVRLVQGADVTFGETKTVNGLPWVTVYLPNKQGYALVDSCRVFVVAMARILGMAFVYADRESRDAPIARLPGGSEVEINETEWDEAASEARTARVSVWLPDGRQGFMPRSTKVRWVKSGPTK